MMFDAHHLPVRSQTDAANRASTDAAAAFLEPMRGTASFVIYGSAARHFLCWLDRRRVPISSVDMRLFVASQSTDVAALVIAPSSYMILSISAAWGASFVFWKIGVISPLLKTWRISPGIYPFMPSAFCRWDTALARGAYITRLPNIS